MMENTWRSPDNSDETNELLDAVEDEWEHPFFLHGMDVGESLGEHKAYSEAQIAFDMGEIELWFAFYKPKTIAEWAEWELQHGDNEEFKKRWKYKAPEQE